MQNKQQIRDKCDKLWWKYWTSYRHNSPISDNKSKKAYQCMRFIEKIYNNAK